MKRFNLCLSLGQFVLVVLSLTHSVQWPSSLKTFHVSLALFFFNFQFFKHRKQIYLHKFFWYCFWAIWTHLPLVIFIITKFFSIWSYYDNSWIGDVSCTAVVIDKTGYLSERAVSVSHWIKDFALRSIIYKHRKVIHFIHWLYKTVYKCGFN